MDVSPFPYHGPLEPDQVGGREDLIADLTARVTEHRVTALLGPRRYGKTSVLRRVAADVVGRRRRASCGSTSTRSPRWPTWPIRLDDALESRPRPAPRAAVAHRRRAVAEPRRRASRVPCAGPATTRSADDRPRACSTCSPRAAEDSPTVVDLRRVLQHRPCRSRPPGCCAPTSSTTSRRLGLVFAGSEPSMMRMLFTDQAQPFYAQADLVEIGPLERPPRSSPSSTTGSPSTDRRAGPVPERIADLRRWAIRNGRCSSPTPRGAASTPARRPTIDDVGRRPRRRPRSRRPAGSSGCTRRCARARRRCCAILASGGSVFGVQAELLDLAHGTAQHARTQPRRPRSPAPASTDGYRVVDPLFADWIANRFPL